jgi:glycine betaine/proline transport system permease protein/glycine betaine/proline transport system substrate-binding protein
MPDYAQILNKEVTIARVIGQADTVQDVVQGAVQIAPIRKGGFMKKAISILLISVLVIALFASCAKKETSSPADTATPPTATGEGPAGKMKAIFADAGWDSIKFHNAVMMFIAENAYEMEAEEISGSTPITWNALLTGDITVYSEVWTDNLATYDDDVASGRVIELGVNYADNAQGIYVPRYVIEGDPDRGIEPMAPDLKTVEDLKNYADVFADPDDRGKGRIFGAISGWAIDEIMRKKYEYYGLDEMYNYIDPGSDAALAAAIAGAYEKGQAIAAYYWEPTWVTGKYDLVLLDDAPYEPQAYKEGKTACPSIPLTVCVHPDFYAANPEFSEFLANYKTSSALTAQALSYIQETGADFETTAKWFLKENDSLLDQWLPSDKAELVRSALNG